MYKLLNLNLNSMYLKNLTDFNDFCKSDFTDDLQFNFSLAFNIIQNKYDLTKFQIISDLDNTYYEDVVKYNKHMDKYYWYEEQEELIDWFYDISYYSLVNIMDSVKVVDGKENDFLYDMINMYLREPNYKWIAELYEHKGLNQPSKQLIILNKKMNLLNDLQALKDKKEWVVFEDAVDFNYMGLFEKINIMDFENVNDLNELNWRIGRDMEILKFLLKLNLHKNTTIYNDITTDFSDLHHVDMHNNEFELISQYYVQDREIYNWDQGVLGGVGHCLNYQPKFPNFNKHFELIEDFIELRNMQRLDYYLEEMDSEMWFGYTSLLETEEFENWLVDENTITIKKYNYVLLRYKEVVLEANFKILNKMINNIAIKDSALLNNDQKFNELNDSYIEYEKLKCKELIQMQLENVPIFNWYTYAFIDENVDLLNKENPELLIKKMNLLEKQLKNEDLKLQEMKKINKLYGKKIIKHAIKNPVNPLTKQYLEKNWDDYNSKSNKTDKLMHDWYKNGKKK
jgi:hypothetical protein